MIFLLLGGVIAPVYAGISAEDTYAAEENESVAEIEESYPEVSEGTSDTDLAVMEEITSDTEDSGVNNGVQNKDTNNIEETDNKEETADQNAAFENMKNEAPIDGEQALAPDNSDEGSNVETDVETDSEIDTVAIQNAFDEEIAGLMSLDDIDDFIDRDTSNAFYDNYPQYVDYNDEMEGVSVTKLWTGDAEYNRPESVTFDLVLDDKVLETITLTAADDWKGSFSNHYPAYKLDQNGNYVYDEKGDKVLLNYSVRERSVENYKPGYSYKTNHTLVDSKSVHLFVPATELKAGEQYIAVSSNQIGSQKIFRAEAYQTDKMLSSQILVSDRTIKDKDGNVYNNSILMDDGDGTYDGLLWNAYDAGNNCVYLFSNVYEIWGECHGLIQMASTQSKMECPHVGTLGVGTNASTQAFYKVAGDPVGNAYKTSASSDNLYLYKEVVLPDGAFNKWQTEATVSNRYDPPIVIDPSGPTASEKTDMTVSKKWVNDTANDRPGSITVHLYADGEDTKKTLVLNEENKWTGSFKELDVYKNGKRISYSVTEDVPDGYSAEYKYDGLENNSRGSTGKGYWVRTDKLVDGETYLIVTSPNTGNVIGMEMDADGKGFSWTRSGSHQAGTVNVKGPITINGQTYATHITQEEAESHNRMQWTAKTYGTATGPEAGYHNYFLLESVSNPGCYPKFNGEGDISGGEAHESRLYYGLQYTTTTDKNGKITYEAIDEAGNKQITPSVENYPDDFSHVFGNYDHYFLLTNNHTGDAGSTTAQAFYLYKFVPTSGPSVTITNTKSEKTSLTVYKNWNDENNKNNKRPDKIRVELLKNGSETGKTAELSSKNGWKYVFEDLPKCDEKGKQIDYSVKELNLPAGYTSSIITGTAGGVEEKIDYTYAWVPVTTMKDNGEYILADSSSGTASTIGITDDGKNKKTTLSGQSVGIKTGAALTDEFGNTHTAYMADEDAAKAVKWTAHASGSYVTLENNGSYFQKGNGSLVSSGSAVRLQYDDAGHALISDNGKYMDSNGNNFNQNKPKLNTYIYERVRIKNTTTVDTSHNVATITNTYKEPKAKFILQKLDGNSGQKLTGDYRFTLKDKNGSIAGSYHDVQVDKNGQILFENLVYGDYVLEETAAEAEYGKMPVKCQITVSKDGISLKNAAELKEWASVDKNSDGIVLLNIKNYKLINMPDTGSRSGAYVLRLGIGLLIGGILLMIMNKRTGGVRKNKK